MTRAGAGKGKVVPGWAVVLVVTVVVGIVGLVIVMSPRH